MLERKREMREKRGSEKEREGGQEQRAIYTVRDLRLILFLNAPVEPPRKDQ